MFDVLPPSRFGAALDQATQGAISVVFVFCLVVVMLFVGWAILTNIFCQIELLPPSSSPSAPAPAPLSDETAQERKRSGRKMLRDVSSITGGRRLEICAESFVMMPLEADLSRVETLPIVPALAPHPLAPHPLAPHPLAPQPMEHPADRPSAFPLYTSPPVGSSVAVADGRADADFPIDSTDSTDSTDSIDSVDSGVAEKRQPGGDQWPPAPKVAGAKVYRFIFASGMLVRVRSLEAFEVGPLPSWAYN